MTMLPERAEPVWLTRDLRSLGLDDNAVRGLRRSGELQPLRRSAYVDRRATTPEDAHRLLILGTIPLLSPDACVSHTSAALLRGLPWWGSTVERVHVTRSRNSSGRKDARVHVHPGPLGDEDRGEVDGLPITSLARTTADCLRTLPFRYAVAVADAALRLGLGRSELDDQLARATGRTGVGQARRAAAFADPRAESVGESFSRVVIHELGLPRPDLQVVVRANSGAVVGRCDFGWEEFGTLGEFDGRVKYGRLLREGQEAGDVVFDEKVREDALRGLGHEVVRWIDADLRRSAQLRARIERAFLRGTSR